MAQQRKGGIIQLQVDGAIQDCAGEFSYNLGLPKRSAVSGPDRVHGYKEEPQVAFIEGEIVDNPSLDLDALLRTTDATINLSLANGKAIMLRNAWYAGEGTGNTAEGKIGVRFEGRDAVEVAAS